MSTIAIRAVFAKMRSVTRNRGRSNDCVARLLAGVLRAHNFQQWHDVRRTEEVGADYAVGSLGLCAHLQ